MGARRVTFQRFEDMEAWQKARELTREVYLISNGDRFGRDFGLRDQIRRASVSVMANIAEGFDRSGTGEFVQFLSIAKGSVGEVKSHLYVAFDQGYLPDQHVFDHVFALATQVGRLIGGLMGYLRTTKLSGKKFQRETRNPKPETTTKR